MLDSFKVSLLLQGLTVFLLDPASEASSLGLTVHVAPLDSDGGKTVRAHFSAIAPAPCPSLSGLCSEGEDCLVHSTSLPFNGTKPDTGWCVRQWQKTVPSDYKATINLGSNTEFYVSLNATPVVRKNSGRLNQPAFVALFPPLRARVNCPHHFNLSVKDLDGDKVRCRFARPEQGECLSCPQHSFIELHGEDCMLSFTGEARAGQYFIYLMAEDFIPVPKFSQSTDNTALSSVPVHLSLTVEESTLSCSQEPVAKDGTPREDSVMFVVPYEEVKFGINYESQLESILEVAVVGPPELYRTGFTSVGPLAMMNMAWVRSENKLARLLSICYAVNTKSLQSEPRCVWLYQREMRTLPAGTELKCEKTEMTLVLPVSSLTSINLAELQLNSPTCPVTYNTTHLTARISLNGCGTKTVHSGSELVYTNTLKSVRPYTRISRKPSLTLPLACRIPGAQVKGPQYKLSMPTETQTFGQFMVWIEIHLPGEGPMAKFTSRAHLRTNYIAPATVRRAAESGAATTLTPNTTSISSSNNTTNSTGSTPTHVGSKINQLDLHLMSNCSVARAELIVSDCLESETEDFAESRPILDKGCMMSNSTLEVVTENSTSRVFRLDVKSLENNGSMMYLKCTVNMCITTIPSQKCPDLCRSGITPRTLVGSVFTKSYTITSGPVSLVVTTAAPTTTVAATTPTRLTTNAVTSAAQNTTTSHAPEQASSVATGVILTTISVFLQSFILY